MAKKTKPEPTPEQIEARRLRGQKAAATRAANEAKRAAEEAQAAALKAREEQAQLVALEPKVYGDYEKALQEAMSAKGDSFPVAWRKVEILQQRCINVSVKLRSAA